MNLTKQEKGLLIGVLILAYSEAVGDIDDLFQWVSSEVNENLEKVKIIKNKNNSEQPFEYFLASLLTDGVKLRESEKVSLMESVFVKTVDGLLEDIIKEEENK